MAPLYLQFNTLQAQFNLSAIELQEIVCANKYERIYVNPAFVNMCLGKEARDEVMDTWGIELRDIMTKFTFKNYSPGVDLAQYKPKHSIWVSYPDILFRRGSVYINDIGRDPLNRKTLSDIKQEVKCWIFDQVIPHQLTLIFS